MVYSKGLHIEPNLMYYPTVRFCATTFGPVNLATACCREIEQSRINKHVTAGSAVEDTGRARKGEWRTQEDVIGTEFESSHTKRSFLFVELKILSE